MSVLIDDELNVQILKNICEGNGVDINISYLSNKFHKHRNTISAKVDKLFEHKIIDKPLFPFIYIYRAFPLMVFEKNYFPREASVNEWIEKDPQIFAAFFVKDEEYNTLLINFHEDFYHYQNWREKNLSDKNIFPRGETDRYPSEAIYLSTKNLLKNSPAASVDIISENIRNNLHKEINDLALDDLTLDILNSLLKGEAMNVNYNHLANELNVHRKTIQRRIDLLLNEKIIDAPLCRFPRIWTPPEYFLVFSLYEIKQNKNRILNSLVNDPHVAMLGKTASGRYNLLLFSNFYRMEEYLNWVEIFENRFPNSIGAIKNMYLSPMMTFSIDQHYVSITYLNKKLEKIYGQTLMNGIV